ncbi:MAG: hypothetical protein ACRC1H_06555, partial [Caldilineaceae bacterium]
IGAPAFDGTLRRLTRDDVALVHDALRRDAEGSAPAGLLERLAALLATRTDATPPPPGVAAARGWLAAVADAADAQTRT